MHSEEASNVNCSAVVFKGYIATIRISLKGIAVHRVLLNHGIL